MIFLQYNVTVSRLLVPTGPPVVSVDTFVSKERCEKFEFVHVQRR